MNPILSILDAKLVPIRLPSTGRLPPAPPNPTPWADLLPWPFTAKR